MELCSDGCFTVRLNVELLLWLAVSTCGSMLSSALIGCFQVQLISVAHTQQEGTQGGKYIFQYFLSQLYHRVIILYIKCGHQKPLLICGALKLLSNAQSLFTFTFAFEIHHSTKLCLYYGAAEDLPHILQDQMLVSGAQDPVNHWPSSSVISPYSVYVVSEILCTVM